MARAARRMHSAVGGSTVGGSQAPGRGGPHGEVFGVRAGLFLPGRPPAGLVESPVVADPELPRVAVLPEDERPIERRTGRLEAQPPLDHRLSVTVPKKVGLRLLRSRQTAKRQDTAQEQ